MNTVILQNVNVQEDWKLVSIWIGGNDLCAVCEGDVSVCLWVRERLRT